AGERIEQAARLLLARRALGIIGSVTEQLLEDHLRIVLHWQRHAGSAPRDSVHVGASVTRSAAQRDIFDRKLKRRDRRVLADLLRCQLIERDARMGFDALLGMRAAQKHCGGAYVIRAGVALHASGLWVREVADDVQTLAEGLQGLEDFSELETYP